MKTPEFEQKNISDNDIQDVNYIVLHQKRKLKWRAILSFCNVIKNNRLWCILLNSTIFLNFLNLNYGYLFKNHWNYTEENYTTLAGDFIYLLNYILTIFSSNIKIVTRYNIQFKPESFALLLFDTLIMPPYISFATLLSKHNKTIFHIFSCIIALMRLLTIEIMLYRKSKSTTKFLTFIFISYFLCLFIVIHEFSFLWFLVEKTHTESNRPFLFKGQLSDYTFYIYSIYLTVINITTIGFGNIIPFTLLDKYIADFNMITGFIIIVIFIAALSMQFLNYMQKNISKDEEMKNKEKSLNMLPNFLRSEIRFNIIDWEQQNSIILKYLSAVDQKTITEAIKSETYRRKEVIYQQNVIKDKMIIVVSGAVQLLSNTGAPLISFYPGSCLGEISLVLSLPAKSTLISVAFTELLVIYKKDFLKICYLYPIIYEKIKYELLKRIEVAHLRPLERSENQNQIQLLPTLYKKPTVMTILRTRITISPLFNSLYNLETPKDLHPILKRLIITPNSSWSQFWEIWIVFIASLIAILYPYFICIERDFPIWMTLLSFLIEFHLIIDIYVILTTSIIRKHKVYNTIPQIWDILAHSNWFYLDLISALYLEPFSILIFGRNNSYFYTFKLNRLFKFYRIGKYIKSHQNNNNNITVRLLKYGLYLFFAAYWFGAILYLSSCFLPLCDENGWYMKTALAEKALKTSMPRTLFPGILSIYFGVSCLTITGLGDILPANVSDYILVTFGIILGTVVISCFIAELFSVMVRTAKIRNIYQTYLEAIQNHITKRGLIDNLKKKVEYYFLLQWYYDKGLRISEKNNALTGLWPTNHEKQILVQERADIIIISQIFANTDLDFIQYIAAGAKTQVLPPNQAVVSFRYHTREICIIVEGYCTCYDLENRPTTLGPGCHFGIVSLLTNKGAFYVIMTSTHVKLIIIDEDLFTNALLLYPDVAREFRNSLQIFSSGETYKTLKKAAADKAVHITPPVISSLYSDTFINVFQWCTAKNEDYSKPFNEKFYALPFKYLLIPITINPQSELFKFWMGFRLVVAIILAILIPFKQIQIPFAQTYVDYILFFADVICFMDLFVMLFVAYYGSNNQLIFHPYKTATHYLQRRFILDFIICFPWEMLTWTNNNHIPLTIPNVDHNETIHIPLLKVLQIYRLFQVIDYLKQNIKAEVYWIKILKYVSITVIIINVFVSLLIGHSCKVEVYDEQSRMTCLKDCRLDRSEFQNTSQLHKTYLLAAYFCTSTLVNCGLGDFIPQSPTEVVLMTTAMFSGILIYCYVFAAFASNRYASKYRLYEFKEITKYMQTFLQREGIFHKARAYTISCIEYEWKLTKYINAPQILSGLNKMLFELYSINVYENILKSITMFNGADPAFFYALAVELREVRFRPKQVIYRSDDIVQYFYIVFIGKVRVASNYNEMQDTLKEAGIFGNFGPMPETKMSVNISALTNVNLLCIKTETLYRILKQFPRLRERIFKCLTNKSEFIMAASYLSDSDDEKELKDFELDLSEDEEDEEKANSLLSEETVKTLEEQPHNQIIKGGLLIFMPHVWYRAVILPESYIYRILSLFVFLAVYVNSITTSYEFAFQDHSKAIIILNALIDIFFILKMFIDSHKVYRDRYGNYVLSSKKILYRYCASAEVTTINFINLPIYYIVLLLPTSIANNELKWLIFSSWRLLTLVRLVYIWQLQNQNSYDLVPKTIDLYNYLNFVWFSLIIHFAACIWFLVACPIGRTCYTNSWISTQSVKTPLESYILSSYFVVSIFTMTGVGDILPRTQTEIIYVTFLMIVAKFLIGIFIAEAIFLFCIKRSALANYECCIRSLMKCLQTKSLYHHLNSIQTFFHKFWIRNKGNQLPSGFDLLSPQLRCDLLNEIYSSYLKSSYIFRNLNEAFIRQLCSRIRLKTIFAGNYLVQQNESDLCMYFIYKGKVQILTVEENLMITKHDVLKAGDMFGIAQGLFPAVPHHFSFRASTVVEAICLCLTEWEDLLEHFPEVKIEIYNRASDIYERI